MNQNGQDYGIFGITVSFFILQILIPVFMLVRVARGLSRSPMVTGRGRDDGRIPLKRAMVLSAAIFPSPGGP